MNLTFDELIDRLFNEIEALSYFFERDIKDFKINITFELVPKILIDNDEQIIQ